MERDGILQTTAEITPALAQILTDPRFVAIQLAILYGSAARDTLRRDSGIDLAVCAGARTPLDDGTLLDLAVSCEGVTGRATQIRDLSRARGVFLKEVLTTGIVLHQTDPRVRGELIIDMLDAKIESLSRCIDRITTHPPNATATSPSTTSLPCACGVWQNHVTRSQTSSQKRRSRGGSISSTTR